MISSLFRMNYSDNNFTKLAAQVQSPSADQRNSLAPHVAGVRSAKGCVVISGASGPCISTALMLCLLHLRSKNSVGKYVLWSRIDQ